MSLVTKGDLGNIDIAILAGGLGTRIQNVLGNTPKILAPINGQTFLDHLLNWLSGFGARHIVLCLGHYADAVLEHLEVSDYGDLSISTVVEPEPLGTGGALVYARHVLLSDTIMVMNGDSWINVNLNSFLRAHCEASVDISILCVKVPNTSRFGRVEVSDEGLINQFIEKQKKYSRLSNKKKNIFKAIISPCWTFFKIYFIKLGFIDGWHGFIIAKIYAKYTFWKYIK